MSLFADGKTTGTVVDSGAGVTHVVPIYEGYALPFATQEVAISGTDLSKFMMEMLSKNYPTLIGTTSNDLDLCEKIKIEHGQVALDFDAEMKTADESSSNNDRYSYDLPSGQKVYVRQERLKCPEILFQPHLVPNLNVQDGIHKQTFDAIMKCDVDIRRDLFQNIVLAGGCTMFKKIRDRMHKEI